MRLEPLTEAGPRCGRYDQVCPTEPCSGRAEPTRCEHWHRLNTWRAIPPREQAARAEAAARTRLDPQLRDAVLACPDRGSVLPLAGQADCGCRGRELTECRARRGAVAGRVTLADCFECRGRALIDAGATAPVTSGATRASPH